eukprot:jgi/Botrbrau1/9601/Bobra.106_2s0023.1
MALRILPFANALMEKEFKQTYHKGKRLADMFTALVVVFTAVPRIFFSMQPWMSPLVMKLWIVFLIAEILVVCCMFHPSYPMWRLQVMLLLQGLVAAVLFFNTRDENATYTAPNFKESALYVMINMQRWTLLVFSAMLYQISLTEGRVALQTFLLVYTLAFASEECRMMKEVSQDIASFASQLEANYQLWESQGSGAACLDLCHNLLASVTSSCISTCRATLPLVWNIYGPPWIHACVVHRITSGVVLGYAIPLLGLYLMEIMERREFARLKGLPVMGLGAMLRLEFRTLLQQVSNCFLVVAICVLLF